eukprot:8475852-Heterocapsa_arctica.AAC.1
MINHPNTGDVVRTGFPHRRCTSLRRVRTTPEIVCANRSAPPNDDEEATSVTSTKVGCGALRVATSWATAPIAASESLRSRSGP